MEETKEVVVITIAGSNPPCAVSFEVGSETIWIRSNERYFPRVPVSGLGNIAGLRDALIEVCERMGAA